MFNWRKLALNMNDTIQSAIEILNSESSRIVLIVDESDRLLGTVTDGDIRRSLIKRLSMDTQIHMIMFKKPTVASKDHDKSTILSMMKKLDLLQIPILDEERRVVGIETFQNLLNKKRYDNPIFLMAGGIGERLQPLTNDTPKPLLKIGKKPILENILEQFISAGFHNFYISVYYKAEKLKKYFGDGKDWGVTINYIHESKALGTAGALGLLPNDLPKLPIIVMNGDILTKIDFEQLLNFHLNEGGEATMCVREYDFKVPYGVIQENNGHVISIEEKPVHKFFINAGIYILSHSIINSLNGSDHIDMPQLLENKIKDSCQINMFPVHEYWLDIGQIEQFNKAQLDSEWLFNDWE
jgi:dTDP-glucose pyrophosphorylase/predicted transcriptional regulator